MSETTIDTPEQDERPFTPLEALPGVIIRPRATFLRMREAERGHWWLVLAMALVALALVTIATVPVQAKASRAAFEAQSESFSDMSPEEQAQVEQMQNIFSSQAVLGILNLAFGAVALVIGYLIRSGLLFLLGLALGGRAGFKQVFRMAVWTTFPNVLRSVVAAIMIFATGNMPASGLSYMFTSAELAEVSPVLIAFLNGIDIYTVWGLVLIGVGMVATAQLSRAKGAIVTIVYWLLTVGAAVGFAAIGQALNSAFGVA